MRVLAQRAADDVQKIIEFQFSIGDAPQVRRTPLRSPPSARRRLCFNSLLEMPLKARQEVKIEIRGEGFNSLLEMPSSPQWRSPALAPWGFNSLLEMLGRPRSRRRSRSGCFNSLLEMPSPSRLEWSRRPAVCVSILYWRCRCRVRISAQASSACFNSLLEMLSTTRTRAAVFLRLLVSILYWRCKQLKSCREVWFYRYLVSILYWRCARGRCSGSVCKSRRVSILYWRCKRGLRRQLATAWRCRRGFNSLLEMPPCPSTWW